MRLTLIHNPSAGERHGPGGGPTAEDLQLLLRDLGHEVRYVSSKEDWQPAMDQPADLFVAAGGDGTVAKVIGRAIGYQTPVAILPLGTANNVARSLRLEGGWRDLAAGWGRARPRPFDVGRIGGPGGELFVEAVGGGLMAELIERGEEEVEGHAPPGGERDQALKLLIDVLGSARSTRWQVKLDGTSHAGDYLAVEVMNIGLGGPNVPLSVAADPTDGLLDVVLVGENERPQLLAYLQQRLSDGRSDPPRLVVRRARSVSLLAGSGRPPVHLDDEVIAHLAVDEPAELELRAGAVSVLLRAAG